MTNEPFFRKTADGRFQPTKAGVGPWTATSLHGRLIIGLLGAEIERQYRTPEYMPARLTVDMYKLPDLSPVEVVTRVVKDGYRIKVIDAEFISGGESAGRDGLDARTVGRAEARGDRAAAGGPRGHGRHVADPADLGRLRPGGHAAPGVDGRSARAG